MTSRNMCASLLVAAVTLFGCADEPAERTRTSTSAIIGGRADDADGPVVWIVADAGERRIGYCSGVVVSPHVVLTAAHCSSVKAESSIFLGADYDDATAKTAPESFVAVTGHHASPAYDTFRHLHDVGVLVTATSIPRAPAAINREPIHRSDVGSPLRIVGFGRTIADDAATMGRRHEATTTLADFDAMSVGMTATPSFCLYDSGGPSFMTRGGQEVVVGIHSIVEAASCDAAAWDARVDIDAEFIDGMIANAERPTNASPDTTETTTEEQPTEPPEAATAASASPVEASSCTAAARPRSFGSGAEYALVALVVLRLRARRSAASCAGLRA